MVAHLDWPADAAIANVSTPKMSSRCLWDSVSHLHGLPTSPGPSTFICRMGQGALSLRSVLDWPNFYSSIGRSADAASSPALVKLSLLALASPGVQSSV
jgi:hypothetical protein